MRRRKGQHELEICCYCSDTAGPVARRDRETTEKGKELQLKKEKQKLYVSSMRLTCIGLADGIGGGGCDAFLTLLSHCLSLHHHHAETYFQEHCFCFFYK